MALTDPNEARYKTRKLIAQPSQFIFGGQKPIFTIVLAFYTPIPKDSPMGKGWACAHTLLIDLPGTGKTALLNYASSAIQAKLGRIDGRPDYMPTDFTGREEKDTLTKTRTLLKGPLHCNIFFADEINRTPPKTQAPMLGAMEGGNVYMNIFNEIEKRIDSSPFPLYPISADPNETRMYFIVIATMNPIEFEGTYPLSEAQKERFTISCDMGVPTREEEDMIRPENVMGKRVEVVMNLGEVLDIQEMVKKVKLSKDAYELKMRYVENSWPYSRDNTRFGGLRERHAKKDLAKFINEFVTSGCSRRRHYHMIMAAKSHRLLSLFLESDQPIENLDNIVATVDDMKAIAPLTMEHVIRLEPRSLGENITEKDVVRKIIEDTEVL